MRCADACAAEDFSALWSELLTECWAQEALLRPAGQLSEERQQQLRLEILEPANEDFSAAETEDVEADTVCAAAALGSQQNPEKPQAERSQGSAAENEDADALDLHPP